MWQTIDTVRLSVASQAIAELKDKDVLTKNEVEAAIYEAGREFGRMYFPLGCTAVFLGGGGLLLGLFTTHKKQTF